MAVTTQDLLDEARSALLRILQGRAQEFYEQNDRVRLLEINRLNDLISDLERKVAAESSPVFYPVVPTNL